MSDNEVRVLTIPAAVHAAARRFGPLEAVVAPPHRPTFAEVDRLVVERARALVASGVGPGDRVAIWAPNSLEWIVVSLAVYSAGGVLVPINTRFKGDEAAYLLSTAGARLLFTVTDFLETDYLALLDGVGGLALDEAVVLSGPVPAGATPMAAFLERAGSVPASAVAAREDALGPASRSDIIFTSGTTGRPKGVVLTHGASIATYLQWSERVGLRSGDRELIVFPFFHTAGLKAGILSALLRGVTLVPHAVFEVDSVMEMVARERITCLPGPPAVFQSILSHPDRGSFDVSTLRLAVTGGAIAPVELIERMRAELDLDSVVNGYGLTELHGTASVCVGTDAAETVASTVGRPLEGLEVRVVDEQGADVPAGSTGEIWFRGFNVTEGYLGDPEATAEAITDGWLHSGDVGYQGADGNLRLVDRKKDVYIVGGFNVASAEVERIIARRDDVAQVAVVAAPDERLGEVGAAFVVARPGCPIDVDELMAWCRQEMANYKVPRFIELVGSLPTNGAGKVQKFALREELRRRHSAVVSGNDGR